MNPIENNVDAILAAYNDNLNLTGQIHRQTLDFFRLPIVDDQSYHYYDSVFLFENATTSTNFENEFVAKAVPCVIALAKELSKTKGDAYTCVLAGWSPSSGVVGHVFISPEIPFRMCYHYDVQGCWTGEMRFNKDGSPLMVEVWDDGEPVIDPETGETELQHGKHYRSGYRITVDAILAQLAREKANQ